MIRLVCAVTLALLVLGAAGCKRGEDEAECLALRTQARKTATEGDVDRASQLLDEARAQCGPKADVDIQRIQSVIDARRRAKEEQARIEARREAEAKLNPPQRMLAWIKLGAGNREVANLACAERGSDDFGFCQGHKQGDPEMIVRYWNAQRDAFRYSYSSTQRLTCDDVGEHRRVHAWVYKGKSYELCELTRHEVRSLSALIERGSGDNTIYVYSQAYLQRDKAFAEIVAEGS